MNPQSEQKKLPLKLIAFDLDSTLIQNEGIDELAKILGVHEEVSKITIEAMKGNLNFESSFIERVKYLRGLTNAHIKTVLKKIKITDDAHEVMSILKKNNYKIALLSGGFHFIADQVTKELGIDFTCANQLEMKDGVCTGRHLDPIVDSLTKASLLTQISESLKIPMNLTVAVGDGANDIPMLKTAGIGVSFNGKPVTEAAAKKHIRGPSLLPLIEILGLQK